MFFFTLKELSLKKQKKYLMTLNRQNAWIYNFIAWNLLGQSSNKKQKAKRLPVKGIFRVLWCCWKGSLRNGLRKGRGGKNCCKVYIRIDRSC